MIERTDSRGRPQLISIGSMRVTFDIKLSPETDANAPPPSADTVLKMMAVLRVENARGSADITNVVVVDSLAVPGVSRRRPTDETTSIGPIVAGKCLLHVGVCTYVYVYVYV